MNEKKRILVIDDEKAIRNLLRVGLAAQGFQVGEAENGVSGAELVSSFHPHLVILDLGLPDINGLEVLKRLRAWTQVPVLILTVTDDEDSKVALLDAGADDYLSKPFGLPELLARIRVAIRNHNSIEATPIFESGNLRIDLNSKDVRVDGRKIKLTATEYGLLSILVRNSGKIVQQSHLLAEIWGVNASEQSHYLRIYIGQIRKKLETNSATPIHIITEPGLGYKIV
mgnify:CR=1 FL=1